MVTIRTTVGNSRLEHCVRTGKNQCHELPCGSLAWSIAVRAWIVHVRFLRKISGESLKTLSISSVAATTKRGLLFGLILFAAVPARGHPSAAGACFEEAGARFGISPKLLQAIAQQESSMRAHALNQNRDGSWDVGLMQINSRWLPTLSRHGVRPEELWDPCVSSHVGAWILASNFRQLGFNWEAVGAYNARRKDLRMRYAQAISRRVQDITDEHRQK